MITVNPRILSNQLLTNSNQLLTNSLRKTAQAIKDLSQDLPPNEVTPCWSREADGIPEHWVQEMFLDNASNDELLSELILRLV